MQVFLFASCKISLPFCGSGVLGRYDPPASLWKDLPKGFTHLHINEGLEYDFSVFYYNGKDKKKRRENGEEFEVDGEIDLIIADVSGAIWTCMGCTVLLCFCLFKTGSLAKGVFQAHSLLPSANNSAIIIAELSRRRIV